MKLRYFYKTDHKKQPIPASNVRRKSKPPGGQWKELKNVCCEPLDVDCTCGPRFFVQVDYKGDPIDYTVIKRTKVPTTSGEGIKYAEIQWKSVCCSEIEWSLALLNDGAGSLTIRQDGVIVVLSTTNGASGILKPPHGAVISIDLNNTDGTDPISRLSITGGVTTNLTDAPSVTTSFVFESGKNYNIAGVLDTVPLPSELIEGTIQVDAAAGIGDISGVIIDYGNIPTFVSGDDFVQTAGDSGQFTVYPGIHEVSVLCDGLQAGLKWRVTDSLGIVQEAPYSGGFSENFVMTFNSSGSWTIEVIPV